MMAHHSNICDDRPNTNDSLDGVIPTDATKEASAENPGLGQGSQVGWATYIGYTEQLYVPMIPPSSSLISPNSMSVSTFTQGGTPKPSIFPLGTSKHQPLPIYRKLSTPFPHQYSASDEVPSPSDSTHGRRNIDKETENMTSSTARRLFKGKSQSPSPAAMEVEGTLIIAAAAGSYVELYGDKKEAGEDEGGYLSPKDVSLSLERGDHGLSTRARSDL